MEAEGRPGMGGWGGRSPPNREAGGRLLRGGLGGGAPPGKKFILFVLPARAKLREKGVDFPFPEGQVCHPRIILFPGLGFGADLGHNHPTISQLRDHHPTIILPPGPLLRSKVHHPNIILGESLSQRRKKTRRFWCAHLFWPTRMIAKMVQIILRFYDARRPSS